MLILRLSLTKEREKKRRVGLTSGEKDEAEERKRQKRTQRKRRRERNKKERRERARTKLCWRESGLRRDGRQKGEEVRTGGKEEEEEEEK